MEEMEDKVVQESVSTKTRAAAKLLSDLPEGMRLIIHQPARRNVAPTNRDEPLLAAEAPLAKETPAQQRKESNQQIAGFYWTTCKHRCYRKSSRP